MTSASRSLARGSWDRQAHFTCQPRQLLWPTLEAAKLVGEQSPEVSAEHAQCDPQRATAGPRNTTHDQAALHLPPRAAALGLAGGDFCGGFLVAPERSIATRRTMAALISCWPFGGEHVIVPLPTRVDLRSNRWGFQWISFWSRVLFLLNLFFLSLSPLINPYQ